MPGNPSENTSMDQVRELLMGTQFKDMENRIIRQEERLLRELADLRESVKNKVESLENFMKSESASLLHRQQEEKNERATAIKNEQRERAEALKAERKETADALKQEKRERDENFAKAAKELAKLNDALERKLAGLSATLDTVEAELRKLLLAESSRLSAAMDEKHREALLSLSSASAQLQNDLVSRSALSATFTEFAVKLAGNLALSGEDDASDAAAGSGGKASE